MAAATVVRIELLDGGEAKVMAKCKRGVVVEQTHSTQMGVDTVLHEADQRTNDCDRR
jgi:hypothetical protein